MTRLPCPRWAFAALLLTVAAGSQSAGVNDKVQSAGHAASAAATKGENAVKKGAGKVGDAIDAGTKKTADAVTRTAKKLGLPTAGASAPSAADQVAK
jgi:hypothetical protein